MKFIYQTFFLFVVSSHLYELVYALSEDPIFTAKQQVDENDLSCATCIALVDVVDKRMTKKSFDGIETRLYDMMDTICDQNNYRAYDFIPPKMSSACRKFMDKHDDEKLVPIFKDYFSTSSRVDRNLLERKICLSISGDCIGNKRLDGKNSPEKLGKDTANEDKHFTASVEELMKKHGHKIKEPRPVKYEDEL